MYKILKSVLPIVLIIAFLVFAGVLMNRSARLLEKAAFPLDYKEIVEEKSKEYDVPVSVIFAVIRTESTFDPNAESYAGARGLMQITEVAFDWINKLRKIEGVSFDSMYDPETNIDYGTWFLAYLYEEFGDWETVYVAYNAGHNAARKWLSDPQNSADGISFDTIPNKTAAHYCEKVSTFRKGYIEAYGFD